MGFVSSSFLHLYGLMCAPAEGDAQRRQKLIEAFCAETMPDVEAEGELRASISTDQFSAMREAPDFKSAFLA